MDIIYLDGKDDYIELYGRVDSTGTCAISSNGSYTFLSAVLVSGGSGDSIWTEEDGVATYDGAINVNKDTTGTYATLTGSSDGGRGLAFISADVDQTSSGGIVYPGASHTLNVQSGAGELKFAINGIERMSINGVGQINMALTETPAVPNMHINATSGNVFRSTAVMYSADETETAIDKKLATKDKIIEALEARLTKLEARNK